MPITVLRLGHRPERDKRLTTHVCLTARALGAHAVLMDSEDHRVKESVERVVERFGGPFRVETGVSYRRVLREHPGPSVHLTMYGQPMRQALEAVAPGGAAPEDLLVVLGAEKVPADVYELADHNVGVGNQPHSEVAALAVFLYALLGPGVLEREFEGAELRVVPQAVGKRVDPLE